MEIVSQSLEYYDKNIYKNKDFFNKINFINIIKEQYQHNIIEFYDSNKKLIKKSKYEILGVYNSTGNIWTWGWSIAMLNKNLVNTSKRIFNYGFDLDESNIFLKNELITSRFKISNKIQLDIHVSIGAYLSKKEMIFSYKIYDDNEINKNIITKINDDTELFNIKKDYDNNSYNEYYLILLD